MSTNPARLCQTGRNDLLEASEDVVYLAKPVDRDQKVSFGEPIEQGCRLLVVETETAGDGFLGVVFTTPIHHSLGHILNGDVEVDRQGE